MVDVKILVVDDENIVLESCRLVLETEGYEVILVSSSDAALKILEKLDPSLLLIDLKMPGRDGMYLMGELKQKRPDIPVLVMSGYATKETIDEVSFRGAAAFIPKPFTPDELLETIRRVCDKEGSYETKESAGY